MKKSYYRYYKKLNEKNKRRINSISRYLQSSKMNQIAYEKVLDKIVHKATEEQDKNPNASIAHMFGYNEEQYCKELIKANKKKSFLEYMLHVMWYIGINMSILFLYKWVEVMLFNEQGVSLFGPHISVSVGELIQSEIYAIPFMFAFFTSSKMIYKDTKFQIFIILIVIISYIAIREIGLNDAFKVDVNVYLPLSASIAIIISSLINKIKRSVAIKNYNLG